MKLLELLKVLPRETYIGITNLSDKSWKIPVPQNYQMLKNLHWEKICDICEYEVLGLYIIRNKTNTGLLIQVYDKKRLEIETNINSLALKISDFMNRGNR